MTGQEILKKFIEDNPEVVEIANRRNKAHVYGVQKFAEKINRSFPDHDLDKFGELKDSYILIPLRYNRDYKDQIRELGEDANEILNYDTFRHITQNSHHPAYWDVETSSHNRVSSEQKPLELRSMTDDAIIEMCCDWASVGAENGNSPQSWFEKNKDKWIFSKEQIDLILSTMEKLWPGGSKETAEFKHEERYFNDTVWEKLNKVWYSYRINWINKKY